MQRKGVPIGELYDLRAVRVLVDDLGDCYTALGVVHATWTPIPSEFDDYIARPKRNDYRSLHTAVIGPGGQDAGSADPHPRDAPRRPSSAWPRTGATRKAAAADAAFDRKIAWMRRAAGERRRRRARRRRRVAGRRVRHRTGRGPRLRADAEGRGDRPARRRDAAGFRLPRAHRGRPPLPRRQGQRPHRAARPQAAQRRPRRDHDRQDRRAASRLADRGERLPRQRALAREGAQLVPQARPRAQRARRPGTARQGTAPAGPARRRPGAGAREVPPRQRRRAVRAGGAGRPRSAPGRARPARTRARRQRAAAAASHDGRRRRRRARRARPADFTVEGVGNLLVQTGALLPAGAGRADRRLPHARPRRQRAPADLRRLPAPGRGAAATRAAGRVGARRAAATRSTSKCWRSTASGCSRK